MLIAMSFIAQGALFPAMNAMLGQWAPPLERSFLGNMMMAGKSLKLDTRN